MPETSPHAAFSETAIFFIFFFVYVCSRRLRLPPFPESCPPEAAFVSILRVHALQSGGLRQQLAPWGSGGVGAALCATFPAGVEVVSSTRHQQREGTTLSGNIRGFFLSPEGSLGGWRVAVEEGRFCLRSSNVKRSE